ncbi:hypothetical protein [Burkholderia contaminans]|uniref:hypothetical protein n=1 Tax=Burkholderia contaminans TaxID=488447 RepID=UPI003BF9F8CA
MSATIDADVDAVGGESGADVAPVTTREDSTVYAEAAGCDSDADAAPVTPIGDAGGTTAKVGATG